MNTQYQCETPLTCRALSLSSTFYKLHSYVENFDEIQYMAQEKLQQMKQISPNRVVNA